METYQFSVQFDVHAGNERDAIAVMQQYIARDAGADDPEVVITGLAPVKELAGWPEAGTSGWVQEEEP